MDFNLSTLEYIWCSRGNMDNESYRLVCSKSSYLLFEGMTPICGHWRVARRNLGFKSNEVEIVQNERLKCWSNHIQTSGKIVARGRNWLQLISERHFRRYTDLLIIANSLHYQCLWWGLYHIPTEASSSSCQWHSTDYQQAIRTIPKMKIRFQGTFIIEELDRLDRGGCLCRFDRITEKRSVLRRRWKPLPTWKVQEESLHMEMLKAYRRISN